MIIKKEHAINKFKAYTVNYDSSDVNIALKISHTYRVANISERIAKSIPGTDCNFSWLLGLLHDIGRFEQFTRFGTFKDALSVDHAEFGADILFRDGLIQDFAADIPEHTAETAIRLHNKLTLPENLDADTLLYTKILRDADKADIFRVLTEPPFDERYDEDNLKDLPVKPYIIQCVHEHKCVPRTEFNDLEALIAQCCMAFELEFQESRKIVTEQGYLRRLLDKIPAVKHAWGYLQGD